MDPIRALAELKALAGVKRDADVAVLHRLRAEIRALERQIQMLDQASIDWLAGEGGPTAYQMSGRDGLWNLWRVDRTREIRMRIAQLSADLERQGQVARRSVGKHQVVEKLLERHGQAPKSRGY
ncbi:hypothetical protein [Mangrovicoccus sp. HB161399]|uniref:hypothetical protein n=1 Tax=Mangrovicoccus sp. HB161399 TaxID=2720392 RepID=UPI001553A507|nr:hypothetical protein [Mangrovicoccus sp. HB161399]